MKRVHIIALSFFLISTVSSTGFSKDENTIIVGERKDKGYKLAKGSYLDVPEDMKIKQVAHNVITHESEEDYMARKFSELEQGFLNLEESVDKRLQKIEKHLGISEEKKE